jgi:hypothetical protein
MSSIEYINSVVLTAAASSVTFDNIPQYYQDLILLANARSAATSAAAAILGTVNSNSSSIYSGTRLGGTGASAYSNRESNTSSVQLGRVQSSISGNTSFSIANINVFSYSNGNIFKTILSESTTSTDVVDVSARLCRITDPIISIVLFETSSTGFVSGSTFTLWGVR